MNKDKRDDSYPQVCVCVRKSIGDGRDKTWAQSKNTVRVILPASLYAFACLVSVYVFVRVIFLYSRITTKRRFRANDVSSQQQVKLPAVGYCYIST